MNISIKMKLGIVVSSLASIILLMFFVTWNATSNQQDDGLVINLAGRQRMLSQKMTKEMLHYLAEKEKTGSRSKSPCDPPNSFTTCHKPASFFFLCRR